MSELNPGQKIQHSDYGEGVIIAPPADGFVRAFFSTGERQVPLATLSQVLDRATRIISQTQGSLERAETAWLVYQSHALPLLDSAAALTSARIDLLPHQVVLTHRVAQASPRRYMIADEVGLGKTIETALILRELTSRGELQRALMVVPAGLVNNWHRELNEVFNLNFEVFGSEGDVFDRKSNAFEKHHFLIASIDTLKQKKRMKLLEEAPPWDLIVFDEAHHLTATRNGRTTRRTLNYKLAELLRSHSRDLLLLSATPHQGDHYRFWMLMNLLNPTLFKSPEDMLKNRHRMNSVVFRRTKADACRPDGSTLFARRGVHTESFTMSIAEQFFYNALGDYLREGFNLAQKQGGKGRSLGFVMTIFQKISASSFAAVRRTLTNRLLALTVQEGLMHDKNLDIEEREQAFDQAREIIRRSRKLGTDSMANLEVDQILNDMRRKLMQKLKEDELLSEAADETSSEFISSSAEDAVARAVHFALPEERSMIQDLLDKYPEETETKVQKLIGALGQLWQHNPRERVVIFATYLGSVEMLDSAIQNAFPEQGVVVLKGGDHGAKLAAERRFRQNDGPKVMICTAAGREGINLQFARILFNFDLPWNPMDLEQRIGRIHRYGQTHTAQVYNLVLSDTIEGKIFLLLDRKLNEIGKTLGKVDEQGQLAEDMRGQILGQLSERLNYDQLYRQALSDPDLQRTEIELDVAMQNASEARDVVFDLFQDLDRFNLEDYDPFANPEASLAQLVSFLKRACAREGMQLEDLGEARYRLSASDQSRILTTERELSMSEENLELIGLDHPLMERYLREYQDTEAEQIGLRVRSENDAQGVLSIWAVESKDRQSRKTSLVPLAVDLKGRRIPAWERRVQEIYNWPPIDQNAPIPKDWISSTIEPMLIRELSLKGQDKDYKTKLIGWIECL